MESKKVWIRSERELFPSSRRDTTSFLPAMFALRLLPSFPTSTRLTDRQTAASAPTQLLGTNAVFLPPLMMPETPPPSKSLPQLNNHSESLSLSTEWFGMLFTQFYSSPRENWGPFPFLLTSFRAPPSLPLHAAAAPFNVLMKDERAKSLERKLHE